MELKPGDKFSDRYQLLSKPGEGGMGEVWKAPGGKGSQCRGWVVNVGIL